LSLSQPSLDARYEPGSAQQRTKRALCLYTLLTMCCALFIYISIFASCNMFVYTNGSTICCLHIIAYFSLFRFILSHGILLHQPILFFLTEYYCISRNQRVKIPPAEIALIQLNLVKCKLLYTSTKQKWEKKLHPVVYILYAHRCILCFTSHCTIPSVTVHEIDILLLRRCAGHEETKSR